MEVTILFLVVFRVKKQPPPSPAKLYQKFCVCKCFNSNYIWKCKFYGYIFVEKPALHVCEHSMQFKIFLIAFGFLHN